MSFSQCDTPSQTHTNEMLQSIFWTFKIKLVTFLNILSFFLTFGTKNVTSHSNSSNSILTFSIEHFQSFKSHLSHFRKKYTEKNPVDDDDENIWNNPQNFVKKVQMFHSTLFVFSHNRRNVQHFNCYMKFRYLSFNFIYSCFNEMLSNSNVQWNNIRWNDRLRKWQSIPILLCSLFVHFIMILHSKIDSKMGLTHANI